MLSTGKTHPCAKEKSLGAQSHFFTAVSEVCIWSRAKELMAVILEHKFIDSASSHLFKSFPVLCGLVKFKRQLHYLLGLKQHAIRLPSVSILIYGAIFVRQKSYHPSTTNHLCVSHYKRFIVSLCYQKSKQ